jgi:hypothetical protein
MPQVVNTTHPLLMPTRDGAGAQIAGTTDYTAEETRRWVEAIRGRGGGLINVGDLLVTALGTPGSQVLVAPGRIWVPNAFSTSGGIYLGIVASQATLDVPAADLSQQRNDAIFYEVQDKDYDTSATYNGRLRYVTNGTLGSGAAFPTPSPASSNWQLAQVRVPAGGTTVVSNANITNIGLYAAMRQTSIEMGQLPATFASLVASQTSGSGNSTGDLIVSTRRATGDATLTEALRVLASGMVQASAPSAELVTGAFGLYKIDQKSGAGSSYSFTSLPQVYRHLIAIGRIQISSGTTSIGMQFNADTASNYNTLEIFSAGAGPNGPAGVTTTSIIVAANAPSTTSTWFILAIPDYRETLLTNHGAVILSGYAGIASFRSGYWNQANAITRLDINQANMIAGSRVSLYGMP